MNEMQESTDAKFYLLSDFGAVFDVSQSAFKTNYGESFDGIQPYCEPGDWLIMESGKILKNIGENIAQWAADSHNFCIPANQNANDFLESHSPGSSYHAFVSTHTGESVLARYMFQLNEWEIIFQIENETEPETQILDSNTFVSCFDAEDDEAKEYMEYIFSLFPVDKNNATMLPISFTSHEDEKDTSAEWTIEARFPCDCYSHEMSFWADNESQFAEFSYWQRGKGEQPWSWKTRLKMVWDILTTGNPYSDMIILNRSNTEKLRDTLNDFLNKTKQ